MASFSNKTNLVLFIHASFEDVKKHVGDLHWKMSTTM